MEDSERQKIREAAEARKRPRGATSSMSDDEDGKIPPTPSPLSTKIRSKKRRTGQKKKLSTRRKRMEDSKRRAISAERLSLLRRVEVGSIIFVLDQGELVWVNV